MPAQEQSALPGMLALPCESVGWEKGALGTPHPSLLILILPGKSVTGSSVLKLLPQVQIYAFSSTTAVLAVILHSWSLTIFICRCS